MGVTRKFSREGPNFQPKISFRFLHRKFKNVNFYHYFFYKYNKKRSLALGQSVRANRSYFVHTKIV